MAGYQASCCSNKRNTQKVISCSLFSVRIDTEKYNEYNWITLHVVNQMHTQTDN